MLHRPALRYSIRFRLPETAMAPESWLDRRGHNRRNEKIHRRRTAGRLADIALDLEHPPVPGLGEFGGEQAHESAEAYQLDAVLVERGLQHRLEAGAILAERL